jgi:ABC-type multidrug transport system ATPase subunit
MVIFTSHNLDTVIEICDRVCVIEGGVVKDIVDVSKRNSKTKLRELLD